MWTYSIEFDAPGTSGMLERGSTMVMADDCEAAVKTFKEAHPSGDIVEIRRTRHD